MAIKGRIWIENDEGINLGKGRIQLLKLIDEHGSLSKAAEVAQISYRKAWKQVKDMNAYSNEVVVELSSGGKGGGNARITDRAKELIIVFEKLERELSDFLKQKHNEYAQL